MKTAGPHTPFIGQSPAWQGGEAEGWTEPSTAEAPVAERTKDFLAFVEEQVKARTAEQDATIREIVNIDWSEQS